MHKIFGKVCAKYHLISLKKANCTIHAPSVWLKGEFFYFAIKLLYKTYKYVIIMNGYLSLFSANIHCFFEINDFI